MTSDPKLSKVCYRSGFVRSTRLISVFVIELDSSRASAKTPGAVLEKTKEAADTIPATAEPDESAEQQSAYDPVTGEINWDCPCLGGMAHGSCGEQFKAAFSCFVHSEEDPKGVDCVDKFKAMQDCFRARESHS